MTRDVITWSRPRFRTCILYPPRFWATLASFAALVVEAARLGWPRFVLLRATASR